MKFDITQFNTTSNIPINESFNYVTIEMCKGYVDGVNSEIRIMYVCAFVMVIIILMLMSKCKIINVKEFFKKIKDDKNG